MERTLPTQTFIDAVVRHTDHCERHGDIIRCKPLTGYVTRRMYETTFENGTVRRYWLRAGKPVMA